MDIKGKTKDNPKVRMDLQEYCMRPELYLQTANNGKVFKPKASYTFTLEERRHICDWVTKLKMPEGYASNLGKKPVGRVEVENVLDVAYQNDVSGVHQIVDDQLENDLEHPERILKEIDINEVTIIENEDEESTDEIQTSEDEEFSEEEQYVNED
ncbi:uncharacterized protein [Nicotiana tomentosiformis]|uniref:uncharacterized protein n=1 Tax=Nicotiana tomentosiformis TaxID=4098 RepID=UPI00388CC825